MTDCFGGYDYELGRFRCVLALPHAGLTYRQWCMRRLVCILWTRLALLHCAEALQKTLQENPDWQPEPLDENTFRREVLGEWTNTDA